MSWRGHWLRSQHRASCSYRLMQAQLRWLTHRLLLVAHLWLRLLLAALLQTNPLLLRSPLQLRVRRSPLRLLLRSPLQLLQLSPHPLLLPLLYLQ